MSQEWDDEALLKLLASMATQVDPVPYDVLEAARRAFGWLNIDAELAELVFDSDRLDEPLVGARSAGGSRQLTFEAPGLVVELEIDFQTPGQLVGQLVPPCRAAIEVRHGDASAVVETNESGWFWAEGVEPGPVSLRITPAEGREGCFETSWVWLPSRSLPAEGH